MNINIDSPEIKAQLKELAEQIQTIKNLPIFAPEEIPLSLTEIQNRGGPSASSLKLAINREELKAHQLTKGGKYFIYPSELKEFLNRQKIR